ncbi:hypothetical protein ACFLQN_02785 [Candidatus Aenigmatarchaeota archaeon]
MAIENITSNIGDFVSQLSITEAGIVLEPLVIFVIGMVIYALFVFKFYRFIARKNIFTITKDHATLARKVGYVLEYIFLFPLIAFFWFFVISMLLSMLSEIISITNIFMISMAIMATIRITAYYSEELSRDIAKLIPFALLAVFLLDISGLSLSSSTDLIREISTVLTTLVYYFVFIIVLEFILRIVTYRRRNKVDKTLNKSFSR